MINEIKMLTDLLEKNIRRYEELRILQTEEWELCCRFDFDGYRNCLDRKNGLVFKIQELEVARLQVLKRLAQETGVPEGQLTLGKLASLVKEPFRSNLIAIKTRLSDLVKSTSGQNREIQEFLENSMEISRKSLLFLHRQIDPTQTYQSSGQMVKDGPTSGFCQKSA